MRFLLSMILFGISSAHAMEPNECTRAFDHATQACLEGTPEVPPDSSVPQTGSYEYIYEEATRIHLRAADAYMTCREALSDCDQTCHRMALAGENFGGETPIVLELRQIQNNCVGEYSALIRELETLERLKNETQALWQQAQHNYMLVKSEGGAVRQPAQTEALPVIPARIAPGETRQGLPSGLNSQTNPDEYGRQMDKALEYLQGY